jgi:DNA gyrase inhibitor GyrI
VGFLIFGGLYSVTALRENDKEIFDCWWALFGNRAARKRRIVVQRQWEGHSVV